MKFEITMTFDEDPMEDDGFLKWISAMLASCHMQGIPVSIRLDGVPLDVQIRRIDPGSTN